MVRLTLIMFMNLRAAINRKEHSKVLIRQVLLSWRDFSDMMMTIADTKFDVQLEEHYDQADWLPRAG